MSQKQIFTYAEVEKEGRRMWIRNEIECEKMAKKGKEKQRPR